MLWLIELDDLNRVELLWRMLIISGRRGCGLRKAGFW